MLISSLAVSPLASHGFADDYQPVDRSMLWRSDEAHSHLVTPDLAGRALQVTAYGYDVLHMDLDLSIDPSTKTVVGEAIMTVTVTEMSLDEVLIDFTDSLTVTGAEVDGVPVGWTHGGDIITVPVLPAASMGDTLTITAGYSGHPPEVGNKGMKFQTYGGSPHIYVLSTPYSTPAITVIPMSSYWRPCKDVPDDKSTFSIRLTVPDTLVACSNGLMAGDVTNGDGTRTFTWQHDYPVSPYLIAFGASDYLTIEETYTGSGDSTLIQHFVFPNRYTQGLESFNITVPAIEYLASIYGEYPFLGEKFGHFTIDAGVAVEEQTLVAYPYTCVNGGHSCDWLLVHELAHQWWGDCVTCRDWKEVWLNEGFASYSEALWVEHNDGAAYFRIYMEGMDNGPYSGTVYDPPYVWSSIVYDKGAWTLNMLRWVMDDEGFFQMLLDYRHAYEHGNVVTDDLVSIAESVYGNDLNWFFDQWVYREGRPDYEYWWEYSGTGPYSVNVYVRQVQSMAYPTYKMPLRIRINTTTGSESYTVWDSLRTQAFVLEVTDEPTIVALDPKHKILADFTEVTGSAVRDPATREQAFLAQNVPNPFRARTFIEFGLPRDERIALRVFDVEGRMVRTLERGRLPAGDYRVSWDGLDDRGNSVAPGVYFYQLVGPDGVRKNRMLLLR
ncbi:MAG: M1 family aminopeptidase [Candidatus Eisenbacteria bacterium]